jgi:hypothetical protein
MALLPNLQKLNGKPFYYSISSCISFPTVLFLSVGQLSHYYQFDAYSNSAASLVLLSALAVPVIMTYNTHDNFFEFDDNKAKLNRLTGLLGMSSPPTRVDLIKEALNRGLLKRVIPEVRELYSILEVEFHPLSIT